MSWTVMKAAVIMMLAGVGPRTHAQGIQPFDPEVDGQCEKALGQGPESDWIGNVRRFDLECGETDLKAEAARLAEIRASMAKRGSAEKGAFEALLAAFEGFRKAYMALATKSCGGGNGCASSNGLAEAHVTFQFLTMAEGFKKTGFPSFSAKDATVADAKLNAGFKDALANDNSVCAEAMKTKANEEDLCIGESELAAAQAWSRYRDAWVVWGAIEWPKVTADSWRT